jgi:hypothetical protein
VKSDLSRTFLGFFVSDSSFAFLLALLSSLNHSLVDDRFSLFVFSFDLGIVEKMEPERWLRDLAQRGSLCGAAVMVMPVIGAPPPKRYMYDLLLFFCM